MYLPTSRLIPHATLLALISQHLHVLGLHDTQEALHSEWGSHLQFPADKQYSQLSWLIQRAMARVLRFWELTEGEPTQGLLDEEISRVLGAAPKALEDRAPLQSETPSNTNSEFIKFEDGPEPVEATLNQLIYWLTPADSSRATEDLTRALCLTISNYCSQKIFFGKLKDRFAMILADLERGDRGAECASVLFAKLYMEWVAGSIADLEPQLAEEVMAFFNRELVPRHPRVCANVFNKTRRGRARSESTTSKRPSIQLGACARTLWTGDFELLDLPLEELARQLTVWSSTRYCAIQRVELLDCAWEKPRLRYRAPNVTALTQHYNRTSQWAEYLIVSTRPLRARIEKMEQLIQLAQVLFDMRNFLDAMGVISGFEANSVFRLNGHFERLSPSAKEMLNDLKSRCSSEGNFKGMRVQFDQALASGKPVVPYIGMLLSDLFKYYDATQTWVNGLINVRKCKGVYNLMSKIEEFMVKPHDFYGIDQVQTKIENLPDIDEDELMALSQEIEGENGVVVEDA
jgi:hypothetical protein